ncbi:hypothetical protein BDV95DRAFT_598903 [Massariosphaeria phaeospora]|uniref:Uncharacterized protein n=1 Tax=Massariosphaeria phaeospora TaxID=100035 RepID=A0A7C8M2P9_9PLEO|nr:hypothetical protein BDV95DRAFT_598903 [Massariosphaeria phaeospora]
MGAKSEDIKVWDNAVARCLELLSRPTYHRQDHRSSHDLDLQASGSSRSGSINRYNHKGCCEECRSVALQRIAIPETHRYSPQFISLHGTLPRRQLESPMTQSVTLYNATLHVKTGLASLFAASISTRDRIPSIGRSAGPGYSLVSPYFVRVRVPYNTTSSASASQSSYCDRIVQLHPGPSANTTACAAA